MLGGICHDDEHFQAIFTFGAGSCLPATHSNLRTLPTALPMENRIDTCLSLILLDEKIELFLERGPACLVRVPRFGSSEVSHGGSERGGRPEPPAAPQRSFRSRGHWESRGS